MRRKGAFYKLVTIVSVDLIYIWALALTRIILLQKPDTLWTQRQVTGDEVHTQR